MHEYSHAMNIYSRSGGRGSLECGSIVDLGAYRWGAKWRDPVTLEWSEDHSVKAEVIAAELVLPPGLPEPLRDALLAEPALLFARADRREDELCAERLLKFERVKAGRAVRLARDANGDPVPTAASLLAVKAALEFAPRGADTIIALPESLTLDAKLDLMRDVAIETARNGDVGAVALHAAKGNAHLHRFVLARSLDPELGDFSKRRRPWTEGARAIRFDLMRWRTFSADLANRALARAGYAYEVDHRSFVDQGVPFRPTVHEGPGRHVEGVSKAAAHNADVRAANEKALLRSPERILDELSARRPFFLADHLRASLAARVPSASDAWLDAASEACVAKTRRLAIDGGERELLTTVARAEIRDALDGRLRSLAARRNGLALVAIRPGEPRSAVIRELAAWKASVEAGTPILGAAPVADDARRLSAELGIPARSLAELTPRPSWGGKPASAADLIPEGALIVADSAELMPDTALCRLSAMADARGGSLILLVDDGLVRAIGKGHCLTGRVERSPDPSLLADEPTRVAGESLLDGRPDVYARTLFRTGALRFETGRDAIADAMTEFHLAALKEGKTAVGVATTPEDAADLVGRIRPRLRAAGIVRGEDRLLLPRDPRLLVQAFAEGDRVLFPDHVEGSDVRSGTLGRVVGTTGETLEIRTDDGRRTVFRLDAGDRLLPAWALSTHAAINIDVDRMTVAVTDRRLDRQTTALLHVRSRETPLWLADREIVPDLGTFRETIERDGTLRRAPEIEALSKGGPAAECVERWIELERRASTLAALVHGRTDAPERDPLAAERAALAKELKALSRRLSSEPGAHRPLAAAARADWGVILRRAERIPRGTVPSLDALRVTRPMESEPELRALRGRLVENARSGLDAASAGTRDELVSLAGRCRKELERIRSAQGTAPSNEHPGYPALERMRRRRDRLAALVLRDPATFRPALRDEGLLWRDVERWAAEGERGRLLGLWKDGPDAPAATKLETYLAERSDGAWERARGRNSLPSDERRREAAAGVVDHRLARRAPELGIAERSLRNDATLAKDRTLDRQRETIKPTVKIGERSQIPMDARIQSPGGEKGGFSR